MKVFIIFLIIIIVKNNPYLVDQDFDAHFYFNTNETLLWYQRLQIAIKSPQQHLNSTEAAKSGCVYQIGDPSMLDEMDRLAEIMRAQLKDWSITEYDGTVFEADGLYYRLFIITGYLNWLFKYVTEGYVDTDVNIMNEIFAHTLAAQVAYVYKVNINYHSSYASKVEFWEDYLVSHFEEKWRERDPFFFTSLNETIYPIIDKWLTHCYVHWTRYHWYMYKLTGKGYYKAEVDRRMNIHPLQFHEIENGSRYGTSFIVWDHGMLRDIDIEYYPNGRQNPFICQPFIYTRNTMEALMDLYYEKVGGFITKEFMNKLSHTFTDVMTIEGTDTFWCDVCGDMENNDIPLNIPRYIPGPPVCDGKIEESSVVAISSGEFDDTGRGDAVAENAYSNEYYPENPRRIYTPAYHVLKALRDVDIDAREETDTNGSNEVDLYLIIGLSVVASFLVIFVVLCFVCFLVILIICKRKNRGDKLYDNSIELSDTEDGSKNI